MKVLVTGASGFIGKNFLLATPKHWDVTAVYHQRSDFVAWLTAQGLHHVQARKIDLTDGAQIDSLDAKHFDVGVYLAANGDPAWSNLHPADDLQRNTLAIVKLLERVDFHKFIFFSSGAVYDQLEGTVNPSVALRPRLPYAISKLASEQYIHHFAHLGKIAQPSIVRFFGAYGAYEAERKIYGRLVKYFGIERNDTFTIRGDGKNFIDAMFVADTIKAIHLLIEDPLPPPTVFDFGSGEPITITELVTTAAQTFGITPTIHYEGAVPEYINFKSNDTTFIDRYGFRPSVPLSVGLQQFYEHLTLHQSH
jgi:nucleoside-diphosphate-sugar epimerase